MDAEYSQICEQAVPILLHCITLPVGADVFWKQIQEEFQSPDWRRRFTAGTIIMLKLDEKDFVNLRTIYDPGLIYSGKNHNDYSIHGFTSHTK